jgi:tetratricopeptide (TPR) repeat protein
VLNALEMADEAHRLGKKRRYSEALAICDKIISNWPHAYVGHYQKAAILRLMDKFDDALKSITRVTQLLPDEAAPYFMRAGVFMEMGRFDDALKDLERAGKRDAENFFAQELDLLRADCQCQLGRLDDAEDICSRVSDEYVSYGLKGRHRGTKRAILDEIRRKRGCGCS